MSQSSTCLKCGTSLPGDAPDKMCPKCLIVAGLMSEIGADLPPTVDCSPSQLLRTSHAQLAPSAPAIQRVFGGYRIVRPLGQGGMGTVYEAEEQASGRRLALKVLSHSLDSEQARTRFFREGRLAASVNHPNSVYVFGTEEIDGMPVITMELVPGGTLHELVKRKGPLPIPEAVDAILQIIGGLEAAAVGGVLHRDVKPSNCFVDADGTVKVGDFGLSISTLARRETTNLTTAGTVLGTPAYASPEQLRGDEIDSRSDIYAVGATLYYLLTGRTPFTADNMVRMLATVLERPAESPRKLRAEIPEELAKVILRCLAKQPAQRPRNYEELRLALLPFTSAAPVPAGLGMRLLAGFLDGMVVLGIAMVGMLANMRSIVGSPNAIVATRGFDWFRVGLFLLPILILVIPEGLWGATLSKAVLGLRVVGLKRRLPGLVRALLRLVIVFATFMAGILVPELIVAALGPSRRLPGFFGVSIPYAFLLLLFVTARRRNGFATVQDLLSGTRVVFRPSWQVRSAATPTPQPAATPEGTRRVGPYHVLGEMGLSDSSELFVGYDTRLFRKVWIRQLPTGAAEVAPALRMLTRQGRLRWLAGKRGRAENSAENVTENWDAYEALSGQPLPALLNRPQPWKHVRFWLADLAGELEAAVKDQTLPATVGMDRVWITDEGRAKLLDFAAPRPAASTTNGASSANAEPGASTAPAPLPLSDHGAQLFLKQVAVAALEGRATAGESLTEYAPRIPMPLHARALVTRIGRFPSFNELTGELDKARNLPAEISSARRLVLLAGCVVPALMFIIVAAISMWFMATLFEKSSPELRQMTELKLSLDKLQSLKTDPHAKAMDQELEIYIAGRFKTLVTDPKVWHSEVYGSVLTLDERRMAESIVASRAPVSEKEFDEASRRVEPLGVDLNGLVRISQNIAGPSARNGMILKAAMFATSMWAVYTGLPALIAAVLFRGGLLLHGLGLAIVTRDGAPARRWRVLCRGMIVWMPALVVPTLWLLFPLAYWLALPIFIAMFCGYIAAALWSLRSPERGVQDFLARTHMVPR